MAEGADDSQKTEEPSSRKLEEARRKGQVAQSREVTSWLVMAGSAASLLAFAPGVAAAMRHSMDRFLAGAATLTLHQAMGEALRASLAEIALALAPLFA